MSLLQMFRRERRGNVAVIFALAAIPVIGGMGIAVDYGRASMARSQIADAVDAAVLAVGSKPAMSDDAARAMVQSWLDTQLGDATMGTWRVDSVVQDNGKITAEVSGNVSTTIASVLGIDDLPISVLSEAVRSINKLEVALVLDTTASMTGTKLPDLKTAAKNLVAKITADPTADVKIAVVPYGPYVNIGIANRNQPWVSVGADYSKTTAGKCTTATTKQVCETTTTKTSCVKYNDGVPYTTTCSTTTNSNCQTVTLDPPVTTCTNDSTTEYRFNGCVGSPKYPKNVQDDDPSRVYPGFLFSKNSTDEKRCTTQLTPLTTSVSTVNSAINALSITGITPTYIPAGLAWGFNVLSSVTPITDAEPYDTSGLNLNPSKVLVLMTDGQNTAKMDSAGKHVDSANSDGSPNSTQANGYTTELCNNIKAKKIEVFTVAFAVTDTTIKSILSACASGPDNYFDASDSTALLAAFSQIAEDLNNLRLAR